MTDREKLAALVLAGRAMRAAQRNYFRNRNANLVGYCKELEKAFDLLVAEVDPDRPAGLFDSIESNPSLAPPRPPAPLPGQAVMFDREDEPCT